LVVENRGFFKIAVAIIDGGEYFNIQVAIRTGILVEIRVRGELIY